MKNEVDSERKTLPFSVIITKNILASAEQDGVSKEESAKSMVALESFLAQPDVRAYQNNNSVFVVKTNQNSKTSMIIPFNIDTKAKYIGNIVSLLLKLQKEGIEKAVFSKISSDMLDVFTAVKDKIETENGILMSISQVKDSLLCIVTLQKQDRL